MSWEEWVFVLTNLAQVPMLLPMFRDKQKPTIVSSIPMALRAGVCGIAYAGLGLWVAFAAMIVVVLCWLVLTIQRLQQE